MQGYVVSQHGWGIPTVPQLSWAQETLHLWQTHARTKWFILCEHWADIAQFYNYYITRTLLGVIKSKYSQTGENQTPTKPNKRCAGRLHCVSLCLIFQMTRGSHAKPANHFLNQSRGMVLQYIAYVIKPRFEPHFAWIFADYSTHTSKPRHRP